MVIGDKNFSRSSQLYKSLYIKRVSRDFFMGTDIGTRKHKDKKKYTRKIKHKKKWDY